MTALTRAERSGLRILYVEDHEDAREMLQMFLETQGFDVAVAATSDEAFEVLRESRFDLVISDYNLPGEDGVALLQRAAAEGFLHCEAIIVTGSNRTPATRSRVVRKPIDPHGLVSIVDDMLEAARAQRARMFPPSGSGTVE